MQQTNTSQQESLRRRLPFVVAGMVIFSVYLLLRLATFQSLPQSVVSYMRTQSDANYTRKLVLAAARGLVYDRHGELLAVNTLDYEIGISPNLVAPQERAEVARKLAAGLERTELEIFEILTSDTTWVQLQRPAAADVAQAIEDLDLPGVTINAIPRRSYPQGTLASQVLGFVNLDLEGHYGIEGHYHNRLAGRIREREISRIPFDLPQTDFEEDRGRDIILTLDRDLQFLAESQLLQAITETDATGGTIIIMNPRNGDVLAMASQPSFDPNAFFDIEDPSLLINPAISEQYEPGSLIKVLTVASALEKGTITPQWAYYDEGRIDVGGVPISNWDRRAHGNINVTQVLVQSLNVGASTIALEMGPTDFYGMFAQFRVGQVTGIDLQGEAEGAMDVPGDPNWSESELGTNSFGQGIAMTPIQVLTAVNAIANDGLMMQPRVVQEIRDGDTIERSQAAALGRPISAETANLVTDMMVATVRDGLDRAVVDGYTIAGKSGTAEIATPIGYAQNEWIMSFVGFLPADDPQVSILIKLDRPQTGRWASEVAAPVFQRLAERLVIMLEIPTDDIRLVLAEQGGSVAGIQR